MSNENRTFGLLLGPSAVGKSTIISELFKLNPAGYFYPSPHITRPLRENEQDKISVSNEHFEKVRNLGGFVVVNEIYGVKYGTPRQSIDDAINSGRIPILDWPLDKVSSLRSDDYRLTTFYIAPKNIEEWKNRLKETGRDTVERMTAGEQELMALNHTNFAHSDIDHLVINENGKSPLVASYVHRILQGEV